MSPLATACYEVLRCRVPADRPELSYTDLVSQLPAPFTRLDPNSDLLSNALGELVLACRARSLPAIAAMVVRFGEQVPGRGYYPIAHPAAAGDPVTAMVAWANELTQVRATAYPPPL